MSLQLLYEEYKDCQKCPKLCASRKTVVFGMGSSNRPLFLVVAEAPGEQEDAAGLPLIGPSGKLLDWFLCKTFNIEPLIGYAEEFKKIKKSFNGRIDYVWDQHRAAKDELCKQVFYTNSVMCHPEKNRKPDPEELRNCKDRLFQTIYEVDPKGIIAVGDYALSSLLGKPAGGISKLRGTLIDLQIPGKEVLLTYPCMPIFHPSYLMRQPQEEYWAETLQDLKQLKTLIDESHTN
jgi:DNA polymerase